MSIAAIIPAAGSGTRMKLKHPKQYHLLGNAPILVHAIRPFIAHPDIDQVVVVAPQEHLEATRKLCANHDDQIIVVPGGKRRQDSVRAGYQALSKKTRLVVIHDGARPLVTNALINRCLEAAKKSGAAIAAIPVKDTLKQAASDGMIAATVDRRNLWQAQTPQVFAYSILGQAYHNKAAGEATDEAMLIEGLGHHVALVDGDETNIKITRPADLLLAQQLMTKTSCPFRIGHGFDAHRFATQRKLILGGVEIPYDLGLAGHSDADVLSHALCDALLGATGKGDIGKHFPDTDPRFAGISSLKLLEQVCAAVKDDGYHIGNIDLTIVCQQPRLAPYLAAMRSQLATTCQNHEQTINIKATTTEKMGYTGRGEGISAHAVVLLFHNQETIP